ncbi:MAG: dicarboxylate/amino acid:cation symporter, partial [Clostridia bacterium]|nr:dicarboxylate/amino acid:cation symporter [Clostridia bacterium]
MKKLFKKETLFIRVAIGFVLGIILGLVAPQFSIATKVVGDVYLNLIKLMIIPIVVCAVFCGIANIQDGALLRKIGIRTVILYVLMFFASAIVSLVIVYLIRPGKGMTLASDVVFTGDLANTTVSGFLTTIVPTNIVQSMANGATL